MSGNNKPKGEDKQSIIEIVIKKIEEELGIYTDGLCDKDTMKPVRIFHGIESMTPDDWESFKIQLRNLSW